jgi:AcrR family transcriptional regulator
MDGRFGDRVRKDRSDAILAAASQLLAEKGYDGFRVEEVAARVGIAKGTVYLDFPGKAELVRAAVQRAGERLIAIVSETTSDISDPAECLVSAVETAARTMIEQPELAIAVECRPIFGPLMGPDEPCVKCRKVLEAMLGKARLTKALADVDYEITAEALLGLLSRPRWRRLAAEEGVREALRRAGMGEILTAALDGA